MRLEDQPQRLQQLKAEAGLHPENPVHRLLSELTDTVSLLCRSAGTQQAVMDGLSQSLEELQDLLTCEEYDPELVDETGDLLGVDEYFDGTESPMYQVKCPQCGETIVVNEGSLQSGFDCPSCGEHLIQAE